MLQSQRVGHDRVTEQQHFSRCVSCSTWSYQVCSWPAGTCDLTCHVSGGNREVAVGLETHKAPFKASTLGKVLQTKEFQTKEEESFKT